jgi:hypothetical protein
MNLFLWANFVSRLASAVAAANGAAPRELAYLSMITNATTIAALTDADLDALRSKYESEVAGGIATTPEELDEIAARIAARGERIQGT